jgi:hypothetical protein
MFEYKFKFSKDTTYWERADIVDWATLQFGPERNENNDGVWYWYYSGSLPGELRFLSEEDATLTILRFPDQIE